MAFNRKIELSVGEVGQGLLISGLDIEFDIERSINFSENTASFTVYNAKSDTRNKVLKKNNNLIFKAGYEDQGIGTIFIGNITTSISSQSGSDWITEIQASSIRSEKQAIQNTYVSLSYGPNIKLSIPIQEIGVALGLTVLGLENATLNLDNGFVFVGSARSALKYVKNILEIEGKSIYIDNTQIVIYNVGEKDSRFSSVRLNYNSGLLNVKDITDYDNQSAKNPKRIEFESLIIPKLQPNGLITLVQTDHDGSYIIEKLKYTGDNFGGDNVCIGEAIE
jgi:hypothetical protein